MHNFFKCLLTALVVICSTIVVIVAVQKPQTIEDNDDIEDVISLDGLHVPELASSSQPIPNFSIITSVIDKKRAFFGYLQPEIQRQNAIVLKERDMVLALQDVYKQTQKFNEHQQKVFNKLADKYQLSGKRALPVIDTLNKLVRRVDVIPEALILVQAANESGWGVSRFAQQGYNFFGLWCFKKDCGFVPKQRNDDAVHEVAKFKDLPHAVMTYIRNLNRHYAYQELRDIRSDLRASNQPITAKALAQGLSSYSERGQEYIDELLSMLRVNMKHMELIQ
jgi:Bax protein